MEIESEVVVHNTAKRHNLGTDATSATAFCVTELILVGPRDFNAFGSHVSTSHVRFCLFHSLHDARSSLRGRIATFAVLRLQMVLFLLTTTSFKSITRFVNCACLIIGMV